MKNVEQSKNDRVVSKIKLKRKKIYNIHITTFSELPY